MDVRTLGSAGPRITTLGFGCWAMGGAGWAGSWGAQDDEDSTRAIQAALDAGVNWFDTAAVYGLGHSEGVLGRALGARRQEVIVATKFGRVWDEQGRLSNDSRYESVLRQADDSLRRLGTDYIDLYQQHWPDTDTGTPMAETMRALDELVRMGKVRYVGLSNADVPLLEQASAVRHLDSLQPPYNLLKRDIEAEILPFCQAHGIGVVAYSPLASGLLSGHYTSERVFETGDWRSRNPNYSGEGLARNLATVERLRPIAARHGRTVAQLALAWVLAHPAVTSAIVGVRRPEHIRDALPAADWRLDPQTLDAIEEALAPSAQPQV